MVNRVEV